MSIDVSQFHSVFFEESFEGLDIMESGLLSMSQGETDDDTVNGIFRAAHSIKGGAGTFGFNNISEFTHGLETLLDQIRNGQREASHDVIETLLSAVDTLREMLTAVQDGSDIDTEKAEQVSNALEQILHGSAAESATTEEELPPAAESIEVETADSGVQPETQTQAQTWLIKFKPLPHLLQTGNEPIRMFHELAELGDLSVEVNEEELPPFTDLDPESCYLSWELTLSGDVDEAAINEVFEWVDGDCELSIERLEQYEADDEQAITTAEPEPETEQADIDEPVVPDSSLMEAETAEAPNVTEEVPDAIEAPTTTEVPTATEAPAATSTEVTPPTQAKTEAAPKKKAVTPDASIRVGTDKVDSLVNLVGELVITQSMLGQIGDNFDVSMLPQLIDGLEQLERNTRELQESIMRIRMLPISFVFNRFPRLVHDMTSKLGKQVELVLTGEQTELDKTVMEKIGDPLVHLVRNSLDHGLETPEKRLAANKPETGMLKLNAYHQGGNIVIEISDDGAGLNEEKILRKAIEKGLVDPNESLSPDKIHELIFLPGFSTADQVSDLSGRGVGMDVVRKNINSLGGVVEVKSSPGIGSTFTIRLPLTLAIMDGQIIQVANQRYIIPLISIIESVEVDLSKVNKVTGKGELYKIRDEYVPLIRLTKVFNLEGGIDNLEDGLLVIVDCEDYKVGLFVDELLAQQQVVIKSLETNFRKVKGVAGATILGDGTVALILDIPGLMTMHKEPTLVKKISTARVA
ncbi:chemotaxis protein CheA [Methylophaga sulfidovorans]|uniref:Chemotaxis protein CheA n=1 Tax=Methylophaga sulfidovorans TaxID=45496 RepID=A0A1I3WRM6_9GAMM|nr:chemotaxis protein CheA [Methylophaga sulfidovorans]SFK10165.1 CheA signal transduction histidine kinase [Methylophaga sulfidovorans]